MYLDPRPEFHRVQVRVSGEGLVASSTGGQRSSRVASLAGANGLVALPGRDPEGGKDRLMKGDMADAVLIGEIQVTHAQ
jgi:gephyrin